MYFLVYKINSKTCLLLIGYGLGGVIGLFSASVNPTITGPDAKQQTAREVFRDMKATTMSQAKNFAVIGAMFASIECAIETVRRSFSQLKHY